MSINKPVKMKIIRSKLSVPTILLRLAVLVIVGYIGFYLIGSPVPQDDFLFSRMGLSGLLFYTVIYSFFRLDYHNNTYLSEEDAIRERKVYNWGYFMIVVLFLITMIIDICREFL